jgi:hypothetical protein
MGFNILPKNAFTGRTSSGEQFEAFEYDFGTYAVLQIGSLLATLLVGGLFSAVSGFIVLIMMMLLFNGRFNPVSLAVPILGAFWLWDCHTGFLFSLFLNIFVGSEGLIFLSCVNVASIVVITFMILFGPSIVRIINWSSDDFTTRYIIFFVAMGILFVIAYNMAGNHIDVNWLGVTHIKV